ncbi:hypothetical protein Bpfe_000012 [Biomphalaria pfeifferi]|uniref:Ig-like domain-containing protein n=1 Tax=Biomphalaria pfeifferi TaxID=112525 RepID=A0AAD8CD93_BIOPF|nr:hypothetical protein Bpfe_000012 [Biomphalaria pfeifferi]
MIQLLVPIVLLMALTNSQETLRGESAITLHKDAPNDAHLINCQIPANTSIASDDEIVWVVPSDVVLAKGDDAKSFHQADGATWVQQTSNYSLIFHNVDEVVAGAYVCRGKRRDDILFEWTVWVHVMAKPDFDSSHRLNVALISAGVALCGILICCGSVYWYRKNKCRYGKESKPKPKTTFIIPQINIVDMSEHVTMLEEADNHVTSSDQSNAASKLM